MTNEVVDKNRRYKQLFNSVVEGLGIVDDSEVIQDCNPAFARIFGEDSSSDVIGKSLFDYFPKDQAKVIREQTDLRRENRSSRYEAVIVTAAGVRKTLFMSVTPRFDSKGRYRGAFGSVLDITKMKESQRELQNVRDELEIIVEQRTALLERVNRQLLAEREALREKNIALKEVIEQVEVNRRQLHDQVQANVDRIARPILQCLRTELAGSAVEQIDFLEECLREISSPYLVNLESRFSGLSSRESEVCHMVRRGYSSKQIATALGTSEETVRKQRQAIRRKFGISGKRVNLGAYLRRLGH